MTAWTPPSISWDFQLHHACPLPVLPLRFKSHRLHIYCLAQLSSTYRQISVACPLGASALTLLALCRSFGCALGAYQLAFCCPLSYHCVWFKCHQLSAKPVCELSTLSSERMQLLGNRLSTSPVGKPVTSQVLWPADCLPHPQPQAPFIFRLLSCAYLRCLWSSALSAISC